MPYQEVMHKFKTGKLHSGSKSGPKVKSRKQAIAIMLSEKRKGVKYSQHGSGPFTSAEQKAGYKVCYTSAELQRMDPDRLHNLKEFVMANRRNGNTKGKVLRLGDSY
jgi:uncharacterized protein DUF6496